MPEWKKFDCFLVQYMPNVVRGEYLNIGVVLLEPEAKGEVRFRHDWRQLRCLDPNVDIEMIETLEEDIRAHLRSTGDWQAFQTRLQATLSNGIQLTSRNPILGEEFAATLNLLVRAYLEAPAVPRERPATGTEWIRTQLADAFERNGVLELMQRRIAVSEYTKHPGDPLKFDFGYRVGNEIKLFQALSLRASVTPAVILASRYPKIADAIRQNAVLAPRLTGVIEDGLDSNDQQIAFALQMLAESDIRLARVSQIDSLAETARLELRA